MQEVDFGFLFCRVCREYGMSYWDTKRLPIRAFWLMSGNINRLMAESDMRHMSAVSSLNDTDGIKEKFSELSRELGKVTKFEEVFDADAMERFKSSF